MTFAQSVYLIFTSVYVCKETVEHLLLSSGEGHHHHHGDETASVYGCVLQLRATCGDIHDNETVSSFLFVCYLSPSFRSSPPLSCSTTTPNLSAVSPNPLSTHNVRDGPLLMRLRHIAAGNRIPSLASLLPSRTRYRASALAYPSALINLLTNPYALAPVCFTLSVLFTATSLPL